jgi:hypothetical protein
VALEFISLNNFINLQKKEFNMAKNIATILLVLFLIPMLTFAQDSQLKVKPRIIDEITTQTSGQIPEHAAADGDYILVDLMPNVFGTGSASINPLAFDPYSGVIAIVHRGDLSYATSSGELFYNISVDGGTTWTRVASINIGAPTQTARYPSMAINNYMKGDINSTTALFSWPEIVPGATWGHHGYGVDQPLGAASTFAAILQGVNDYSSDAPAWASDDSPWVFWQIRSLNANYMQLIRTEDFLTMEEISPPEWSDTAVVNGSYIQGGICVNGVQYVCAFAQWSESVFPALIDGWTFGYSKSADNGLTWTMWDVPDFRTIPALSMYDQSFDFDSTDGNTVQYDGDIQVDANGYVHLVTALTDTNTWSHAVVDIFETASGWDGEVIFHGLDINAYGLGPGLGQMGPSTYVAMDSTREVMAVQFINKGNSQWADVYMTHKRLDGIDTWSAPINLTNSDNINNTAAHFAPQIRDNGGGSYTAFSSYSYVTGATGPFADSTQTTDLFFAEVDFEELVVGVEDEIVVNSFNLEQNYPNPFNPSTSINFTLAEKSDVSLKVFDVLGNEVATLVNTTREAGKHSVNFDATELASGLYIYTLNAGTFTSSKKMMLLK